MIIKIIVWILAGIGIMNIIQLPIVLICNALIAIRPDRKITKEAKTSYLYSFSMLSWFIPLIIYLCCK